MVGILSINPFGTGHVIASDGPVSVGEGEPFRALAATLDCPMPTLGMVA